MGMLKGKKQADILARKAFPKKIGLPGFQYWSAIHVMEFAILPFDD
jgi:hypothetical protein